MTSTAERVSRRVRRAPAAAFACALLVLVGMAPALAAEPVAVTISAGSGALTGKLLRPDGAGPFPAIVALHDCAGLTGAAGELAQRYRDWADPLLKAGYVVVFPSRERAGRRSVSRCMMRDRGARLRRERVEDAFAVKAWLQQQSYILADHVALMGWGSGATAVLWAVRPRAVRSDGRDFRSAVAVQPACGAVSLRAWSARIPTLLIKGRTEGRRTRSCQQVIADARGRSALARVIAYAGPLRKFEPRAAHAREADTGLGGILGLRAKGVESVARASALRRITQWLAR